MRVHVFMQAARLSSLRLSSCVFCAWLVPAPLDARGPRASTPGIPLANRQNILIACGVNTPIARTLPDGPPPRAGGDLPYGPR